MRANPTEQELWQAYWATPTKELRNQLVELNYHLATKHVAIWQRKIRSQYHAALAEATDDALIHAVEAFTDGHGAQFRTYAITCMRNATISMLQNIANIAAKQGRQIPDGFQVVEDCDGDEPEPQTKPSHAAQIAAYRAHISEAAWEMLRARYMLGVSPREIAKSRGVSRGCVYATCRKALQKIRKNFRKPDQS